MARTKREKVTVRWIDAETGEDFTDRMNDPSIPPGEGILELARALGRLMAARQVEAERQLPEAVRGGLKAQTEEAPLLRTPQPGDELVLNGVIYRYDGSSGDRRHDHHRAALDWLWVAKPPDRLPGDCADRHQQQHGIAERRQDGRTAIAIGARRRGRPPAEPGRPPTPAAGRRRR